MSKAGDLEPVISGLMGFELTDRPAAATVVSTLTRIADGRHPSSARVAEIQGLLDQATKDRNNGALDEAEAQYRSALDLAIHQGARRQEGWAWDGLGACRWRQDDPEMAVKFFTRALNIAEDLDDALLRAWSFYNFGVCQRRRGDLTAAEDYFTQALALADTHGFSAVAGWTYHHCAELALGRGDLPREREMYAAALRACADVNDDVLTGWSLIRVAECAAKAGEVNEAIERYRQALAIGTRTSNYWMTRHAQEALEQIDPQLT